jgi:hypothetical protein
VDKRERAGVGIRHDRDDHDLQSESDHYRPKVIDADICQTTYLAARQRNRQESKAKKRDQEHC